MCLAPSPVSVFLHSYIANSLSFNLSLILHNLSIAFISCEFAFELSMLPFFF